MKIDLTKCKGCGICGEVCPLGILSVEGKKVRMGEGCVECKTCMKVCPKDVFTPEALDATPVCVACPIGCRILRRLHALFQQGGRHQPKGEGPLL